MAKSYIDGCICGKLPVNRSDINPGCPLHGALLAIWPTDDPAVNASLTDPEILKRVTDPEWLRRAADYIGGDEVKVTERAPILPIRPPFQVTDHVRLKNGERPASFDYFDDGTNIVQDVRVLSNGRVMIKVFGGDVWPAEDLELDPKHQSMLKKDRAEETRISQTLSEEELAASEVTPEWAKAWDAIHRRVKRACRRTGLRCSVVYQAYPQSENVFDFGLPIDNLDVVATPQRIVLIYNARSFGNGQLYISPILDGPTWMDLAICANAAIHTTQDHHHVYFENISRADEEELKPRTYQKMQRLKVDAIYRLQMGS